MTLYKGLQVTLIRSIDRVLKNAEDQQQGLDRSLFLVRWVAANQSSSRLPHAWERLAAHRHGLLLDELNSTLPSCQRVFEIAPNSERVIYSVFEK